MGRNRFLVAGMLTLMISIFSQSDVQAADWQTFETQGADGTRIAYYSLGSAQSGEPPLLVISGGPGSDHRYMRVGRALDMMARERQILMFDQRGTSASGAVTGPVELGDWTQDLEAVRQAAGADRIDLMGHSFGGFVAMDYVRVYPDHVRALIFANSMGPTLKETKSLLADVYPDRIDQWTRIRSNLTPRFPAGDISYFARMEFVDPSRAESFVVAVEDYIYNVEVNNELRKDMASRDFTSTLQAFEGPALIVHGRFDSVIAPSTGWALHALMPQSKIEIVERSGHLPFAERPEKFAEIVTAFLSSVDGE